MPCKGVDQALRRTRSHSDVVLPGQVPGETSQTRPREADLEPTAPPSEDNARRVKLCGLHWDIVHPIPLPQVAAQTAHAQDLRRAAHLLLPDRQSCDQCVLYMLDRRGMVADQGHPHHFAQMEYAPSLS